MSDVKDQAAAAVSYFLLSFLWPAYLFLKSSLTDMLQR